MEWLYKHRKLFFLITTFAFIGGGLYFGFGGFLPESDVVLKIGSSKITLARYENQLKRAIESLRQNQVEIDENKMRVLKQDVLQNIIALEAFYQEAKKSGIVVTDKEVAMYVRSNPAFQMDGVFNPELYRRRLIMLYFTPKEYESEIRKSIAHYRLNALLRIGVYPTGEVINIVRQNTKEKDENKIIQLAHNELLSSVNNIWLMRLNERIRIRTTPLYREITR